MNKIFLTWNDIENQVKKLIKQLDFPIDSIYGLKRGGLIPAVILSHELSIPLITDVKEITPNTLIVDDICDTGATFLKMFSKYPNNKFVCLQYKPHTSKFKPNFWAQIHNGDEWIIYPWERMDSETIADYLK